MFKLLENLFTSRHLESEVARLKQKIVELVLKNKELKLNLIESENENAKLKNRTSKHVKIIGI